MATLQHLPQILNILRPGCAWALKGDHQLEDLEWSEGNTEEPPTEAECLAVQDQAIALKEELVLNGQFRTLRKFRDRRLAETDWWASSDRTMTAEQTAYRQALRDLPANTVDPANPVWPDKP